VKTFWFVRYLEMLRPPFTVARNTFESNGTFFAFFVMAVAAPVVATNKKLGRSDLNKNETTS
jgi:hypothetical protein